MATPSASPAAYSFSSAPKAVTARKYREPGEVSAGLYRPVKETCITWDKRVHRGNTYSMYTQNAIKEAIESAQQTIKPPRKRPKPKDKSIFDMPLPEHERVAVDLTKHLVAQEAPLKVEEVELQTDEFLDEPPPAPYQPQRTGIDASTQVEDGELFDFDREVEPILDVLVMKTLEQSIMEVEEEHELSTMHNFKDEWYERQRKMMAAWHEQVEEEWVRWREKEAALAQQRAQKQREAEVLLKIQAVHAAKAHLASIVPNAAEDLRELAFPDDRGLSIQRHFLPSLFQKVQQEVASLSRARQQIDIIAAEGLSRQQQAWQEGLEAQRAKSAEVQKLRLEEMQRFAGARSESSSTMALVTRCRLDRSSCHQPTPSSSCKTACSLGSRRTSHGLRRAGRMAWCFAWGASQCSGLASSLKQSRGKSPWGLRTPRRQKNRRNLRRWKRRLGRRKRSNEVAAA
ncbi:unnamed protein product [Effrenium voratum]|nr:unnamed protein product [Effrenium voratum]